MGKSGEAEWGKWRKWEKIERKLGKMMEKIGYRVNMLTGKKVVRWGNVIQNQRG